jgi:hypothetical protein
MILPDARQAEYGYEAVRREVVQGDWGRARGLALLRRGGMVSWMQALSSCAPFPSAKAEQCAPLAAGTAPEIVRLVAGMVLGQQRTARA